MNKEELDMFNYYLNSHNSLDVILNPIEVKNLIIFGAGKIAGEIIKKTNFFKKIQNFDLVDSDKNKIGRKIYNKEIKSPKILEKDNRMVLIATAQFYDEVYNKIIKIKGSNSSILSGLII